LIFSFALERTTRKVQENKKMDWNWLGRNVVSLRGKHSIPSFLHNQPIKIPFIVVSFYQPKESNLYAATVFLFVQVSGWKVQSDPIRAPLCPSPVLALKWEWW
jgi:hypothetical protein